MTYTFLKERIIEGYSGNYRVWVTKERCNQMFYFYAQQMSVVHQGKNIQVKPGMDVLRMSQLTPNFFQIRPCYYIENIPVEEYEIKLNDFKLFYTGKLIHVKKQLEGFCREIQRTPPNEMRRVT